MSEIPEQPKKSPGDVVHSVVRATIAAVPYVGSPAVELVGLVFGPPLEKRKTEWLDQLAAAIKELNGRVAGLTAENLSSDPAFVTMAMRASEIATRTHQREKIDALRNAIVNSKLPDAIDETMQHIFLNYIDALTPWHLNILSFFDDPPGWMRAHGVPVPNLNMGSPGQVLELAMPELSGKNDFYNRLVEDLVQRGLMSGGGIHTTMTGSGTLAPRTTPWAKLFVHFISKR